MTFRYRERLYGRKIRLLKFDRLIKDKFTLQVVDFDKLPHKYNALSYVWGDQAATKQITCNEQTLLIGENLYNALNKVRQHHGRGALWVDAISINQTDMVEKAAQVRMMGEIYSRSHLVVSWLGEEVVGDRQAINLLELVHKREELILSLARSHELADLEEFGLPGISDRRWKFIANILMRPYFTRIWIVQELLKAQNGVFLCGDWEFEHNTIFSLGDVMRLAPAVLSAIETAAVDEVRSVSDISALRSNPENYFIHLLCTETQPENLDHLRRIGRRAIDNVLGYWQLRHTLSGGTQIYSERRKGIDRFLGSTIDFETSNPLDKIFAVAGFLRAGQLPTDFIDYSKTPSQVQIELAKESLKSRNIWDPPIFCYVNAADDSTDLPSWVPNWISGKPSVHIMWQWYDTMTDYVGKPVIGNLPNDISFGENDTLLIPGKIIDQVSGIVHKLPRDQDTVHSDRDVQLSVLEVANWHETCFNLGLSAYVGNDYEDQFWRALICDQEAKYTPATPEFEVNYIAWTTRKNNTAELIKLALEIHDRRQEETSYTEQQLETPSNRAGNPLGESSEMGRREEASARFDYLLTRNMAATDMEEGFQSYDLALWNYGSDRKFCVTEGGKLGWVPGSAKEGDIICVFQGFKLPFVIRKCGTMFRLVGEAYVHGLMFTAEQLSSNDSIIIELM